MPSSSLTCSPFRQTLPWVAFIAFLFWMSFSARAALSPLMVYMEADLGIGHSQATSVIFAQGVGLGLSFLVSGFMLAFIRPRQMIVLSHVLTGLTLLAMPLVANLAGARMLFAGVGFTSGLYFSAGLTTLRSLVRHEDWGKAVGIHEFAPNFSFILFPLIAEALLPFGGWRGVLMIWGGLLLLGALVFHVWGKGGYDYTASVSLRGGLALFKHPTTLCIMLFLFLCIGGQFAVYMVLQLFLVNAHALPVADANLVLSSSRLFNPIMVLVGGWAADRFSARHTLLVFFSMQALGLVLMSQPAFAWVLVGIGLQSVSVALAFPSVFKLIGECFAPHMLGIVLSMCMPFAGLAGTGLAPWLLGLAGERFSFGTGFLALAGILLFSLPLTFLVKSCREDTAKVRPTA